MIWKNRKYNALSFHCLFTCLPRFSHVTRSRCPQSVFPERTACSGARTHECCITTHYSLCSPVYTRTPCLQQPQHVL